MKKIIYTALAAFPCWLFGQQSPQGTYYQTDKSQGLIVRLNADNTYEIVSLRGTYRVEGNSLKFDSKIEPVFEISKLQSGEAEMLTVKLGISSYINEDNLMIGYEQEDGSIKYESVTSILKEKLTENQLYDMYSNSVTHVDFQIPKTANLYLAFGVSYENKDALVEQYAIGRQTTAVNITYDTDALYHSSKASLEGSIEGDNLSIWENGYAVNFNKNEPAIKERIRPTSSQLIPNWEHFPEKKSDEFYLGDAAYLDGTEQNVIKKEIKTNLNDALKFGKDNDKVTLIFYMPNDENVSTQFENVVRTYERDMYYYTDYETVELYLASEKDKKWIGKKGFAQDQNAIIAVDAHGDVIYSTESSLSTLSKDLYYSINSLIEIALKGNQAKNLDQAIGNKKSTENLQKAFLKIIRFSGNNYFGFPSPHNEIFQNSDVSEKGNAYLLKATPEQVQNAWNRLVVAHKNDASLDKDFANLLISNYFNLQYGNLIFEKDFPLNESDLDALQYLLTHHKEIETFRKSLDSLPYRSALVQQYSNMTNYYYSPGGKIYALLSYLEKDSPLHQKGKELMLQANKLNLLENRNLIYYIKTYFPEEYLTYFDMSYREITTLDPNLILALDKQYSLLAENGNSPSEWNYFKSDFADNCNSAAWHIVENGIRDEQSIKKALQWSESSLKLAPENAYYLDTMAHLLYFKGDKNQAIAMQRKAVELIQKTNENAFFDNTEMIKNMKEALKNMENGSLE